MSDVEERLTRIEAMIEQLIQMVAKNNSTVAEIKSEMVEMKADMAAMEGRLTIRIDGMRDEVTLLRAHSDHFAQKIGLLERDLAGVRSQA